MDLGAEIRWEKGLFMGEGGGRSREVCIDGRIGMIAGIWLAKDSNGVQLDTLTCFCSSFFIVLVTNREFLSKT